jgi:ABC-type bacteriocin/lantibiotic exporter with double-glycine peptidase domain
MAIKKIARALTVLFESKKDKQILSLVFISSLLGALFTAAGVLTLAPFFQMATEKDFNERNQIIVLARKIIDVESDLDFKFYFGLLVLFFILMGIIFQVIENASKSYYTSMKESWLSQLIFGNYLNASYEKASSFSAADISKDILSDARDATAFFYSPWISLITGIMTIAILLAGLAVLDPLITFSLLSIVAMFFVVVFFVMRRLIVRVGKIRSEQNSMRFSVVTDAAASLSQIKIFSVEKAFENKLKRMASRYAWAIIISKISATTPKFLIEAIGATAVLVFIAINVNDETMLTSVIPTLSSYFYATYRLLPQFQKVYAGATSIQFSEGFVADLVRKYEDGEPPKAWIETKFIDKAHSKQLSTTSGALSVEFKDVVFTYAKAARPVLKIPRLEFKDYGLVAIVGPSGCGKSTLLKLCGGLFQSYAGNILVNGEEMRRITKSSLWKEVGYVPQDPVVLDGTLLYNVALAGWERGFDVERAIKCLDLAGFSGHITTEDGITEISLDTHLGLNGRDISGGQRQRIAIARALYSSPKLLLLDEGTSALDEKTEKLVLSNLANIEGLTVLMVAHRSSALKMAGSVVDLSEVSRA